MDTQKITNPLFQRRADLTFQTRFLIAYIVSCQKKRGVVTQLSGKYKVSRTFIYQLRDIFSIAVENNCQYSQDIDKQDEKRSSLNIILSLRFEGKCGIEGISSVMQRLGLPFHSVGFISQALSEIGNKLTGTLSVENSSPIKVVFCSDEIFAAQTAILITVEPTSLAILSIELAPNRKGDTWQNHWENIVSQGYIPLYFVKDQGTGMESAQKSELFKNIGVQTDTFHTSTTLSNRAVALCLGLWLIRLEKAAYRAIEHEYECFRLWDNAVSMPVFVKRGENYEKAVTETFRAIELYEWFKSAYHSMLECFNNFDKTGKLKEVDQIIEQFNEALELIKLLEHKEINQELKSIENCKNDLFYFAQIAKEVIQELSLTIDNQILIQLCLAWQVLKTTRKLKGQSQRKNALQRKEQYILESVKERIGENYENIKNQVYGKLDQIVQSSAAVECINSILRPYLNTIKNQPTQEFLNLFMFYHNHRRFSAGKRKGKTPIEILTGKVQSKDWTELLLEKITI